MVTVTRRQVFAAAGALTIAVSGCMAWGAAMNHTLRSVADDEPSQVYVVDRWVDGDTLYLSMDGVKTEVRLSGVDTPEYRSYGGKNECVNPELAKLAEERANELAPPGTPVVMLSNSTDRYGRTLAWLMTADLADVGGRLVFEHYARLWPDGECPTGDNLAEAGA